MTVDDFCHVTTADAITIIDGPSKIAFSTEAGIAHILQAYGHRQIYIITATQAGNGFQEIEIILRKERQQ